MTRPGSAAAADPGASTPALSAGDRTLSRPAGGAGEPAAVRVLTIGVTGNAGSGKSSLAAVWQEVGAQVVDADALARELIDGDRELRRRLAIEFGEHVLEPSASADVGPLRRQELARRAFASPERTRALNRLVHPPLMRLLGRRLVEARRRAERLSVAFPDSPREASKVGVVVVDAALIFEVGVEGRFDALVLVTAPLPLRIERLRARGLDEGLIRAMAGSQMPDQEKVGRAGHVLVNDGSLDDLRSRALELLARICSAPGGTGERGAPGAVPRTLPISE